jgi:syntaxin 5
MIDRTTEFSELARSFASHSGSSASAHAAHKGADTRQHVSPLDAVAASTAALAFAGTGRSAFSRAAAEVSQDLHMTSSKLQRLTQLVKRRDDLSTSAGNSTTSEIEQVTASVQADLRALDARLDALSLFLAARRDAAAANLPSLPRAGAGSTAEPDNGDLSKQALSHGDAVVTSLKGQLLSMAGGLKGVLQTRTQTVKASAERRQHFGRSALRDLGKPLLLPSPATNDNSNGSGDAIVTVGPIPTGANAFQQVAMAQVEPETAYLQARASDIVGIERSIGELSGLFNRLASVVMEQGSLIDRIDSDVEASLTQISAGESQLRRYLERVSSNRTLALQVTAILLIFIFLFVFLM